jgi:hypothetical protein
MLKYIFKTGRILVNKKIKPAPRQRKLTSFLAFISRPKSTHFPPFYAVETAGLFEIFDLSSGFAKTNPPSKTSISCGLP